MEKCKAITGLAVKGLNLAGKVLCNTAAESNNIQKRKATCYCILSKSRVICAWQIIQFETKKHKSHSHMVKVLCNKYD